MTFRYHLDPSSRKYKCPECDKKRFVRYIDKQTNELAPPEFGKCDRADECKYIKYPKSDKFQYNSISYIKKEVNYMHYLSYSLIPPTLKQYGQNNFISFLYSKFTHSEVQNVIDQYKIGTAKHFQGGSIFWLIDINNKLRSGKIMLYDSNTGKRVKEAKVKISWVHNLLKWQKKLPKNYKLKQCLFGEHLVMQLNNCNKTIAIVESEKTAIIMAILYPKYIWLATGSKTELKLNKLLPIKERNIILYPDKLCFKDWEKIACELNAKDFNVVSSSLLEGLEIEKGSDLVDLLF